MLGFLRVSAILLERLEVSRSIQMSYGRALGKPPFPVGSALARVNCEAEQGGNNGRRASQWRHNP